MTPTITAPAWSERPLTAGRPTARSGQVGSGMFSRVDYLDMLDGTDGRALVRTFDASDAETSLSQVLSTGHEIGLEEDRFTTLLVPLSGHILCATVSQDLSCRPGEVLLLPRGRRRTLTRREGGAPFHAIVLNLAGLSSQPMRATTARLAAVPDLAMACALLTSLCSDDGGPQAATFTAVGQLLRGTLVSCGTDRTDVRVSHRRGVSSALARAEALMQERYADELSIAALADAAGISQRQMQDLFRRKHGLSPHAYLTRLRLEQAHLALKAHAPAASVTEAALSAGFSHLGRFPAAYRARFGTLPSETLAALR